MAKQIRFTADDKEYTLCYTRASVRQMERQGFVIEDMSTKPMTTIPALFAGAFIAQHPFAKNSEINKIYDQMSDKTALIEKLVEMYNDTLETLLETKDSSGNISWTPNWENVE